MKKTKRTSAHKQTPHRQPETSWIALIIIITLALVAMAFFLVARHLPESSPLHSLALVRKPDAHSVPVANGGTVKVDPAKIVTGQEVIPNFNRNSTDFTNHGISKTSYEVIGSKNYLKQWWQYYESYLPDFTATELTGFDATKIQTYFQQKYQADQEAMEQYLDTFAADDTLSDIAPEKEKYIFQNYTAQIVGRYLVVTYHQEQFDGGAHPSHADWADNFDADGKLLTLSDVFNNQTEYKQLVGDAIREYQQAHDIDSETFGTGSFTGLLSDDIPFRLTDTGVALIFNEYEIAPYSDGTIELTIPYSKLKIQPTAG